MNQENKNMIDNQEIDLLEITNKIGGFFEGIQTRIFRGILFIKRNILKLVILIVMGSSLGYYLDVTNKTYNSEIIVNPNFGSTDYLYSKIELIKSKIKDNDTVFLKQIVGIKEPKKLKGIKILPVIDVYQFVNSSDKNFELIKLLSEEKGDLEKIVKDKITSKNYPFHMITIITSNKTTNDKMILPLLNYLNKSVYFNRIRIEYIKNTELKIFKTSEIISQIDRFLNAYYDKVNSEGKGDNLVYYNENNQLNEVIKTKDNLLNEQADHRLKLMDYDKIIKDNSITLNIISTKFLEERRIMVLPALLVILFLFSGYFRSYYRKQMLKLNN